ncbi:DUF6491 family protein [Woodsholea maritima]|uniref:DUF6491 family protein n=1 Tax=Woodsholea maritima TaxID=240237 RepID=UPI00036F5645|nr:DUF6491 family protein [Woodsholea maritima]
MSFHRRLAVASLIAATFTAAPAFAQDGEDESRCLRLRNINGYSVIDDQHLILNGGASHHYLVTTRQRCSDMRVGMAVGTSFSDNARICNARFEYIQPTQGPWRCQIDTIEEVDSPEAARALIEQRAQESASQ